MKSKKYLPTKVKNTIKFLEKDRTNNKKPIEVLITKKHISFCYVYGPVHKDGEWIYYNYSKCISEDNKIYYLILVHVYPYSIISFKIDIEGNIENI